MVRRTLRIGRWLVYFLFFTEDYDKEMILSFLDTFGASDAVLERAGKIMEDGFLDRGFTFSNPDLRRALVVTGPSSSGAEFINTLAHELHHLSVAIAQNIGFDLEGEEPAYIQGDTMGEFIQVICRLGCDGCH